jgi:hypothetical protein
MRDLNNSDLTNKKQKEAPSLLKPETSNKLAVPKMGHKKSSFGSNGSK